jgi:diadenosine tetraphosphate (Ap4A) HIT family hydrolase
VPLTDCPYCSISRDDSWLSNELASAVPHVPPLARFHFVIVPKRHVGAFYDLDVQEQRAVWSIIGQSQQRLSKEMELLGFDIGFQDREDGGGHALVHIVPRLAGETVPLTPGMEWVFAESGSI